MTTSDTSFQEHSSKSDDQDREIIRDTILITHANPEDNAIASWIAAKLSAAGYRVWIDLLGLRGGADFWDEIDDQLRNRTIKQIVLISKHISKQGVKKELAIGDIVGKQLEDKDFMIPVRVGDVSFSLFPPELVRRNAHNAYPNWADALKPLLTDLREANVPKIDAPDDTLIEQLIASRETGRNTIVDEPEVLLSNWFELDEKRPRLHFFALQGTETQKRKWMESVNVPFIEHSGLVGTFCDPVTFTVAGGFGLTMKQRFTIPFGNLVSGDEVDPFSSRADSRKHAVNLMRQHWDQAMQKKGLIPFEYADKRTGWFFPDGLIDGKVKLELENGARVNRVLSGKFKDRRWHLCLVAKPQIWPEPMFRIHANVALSEDGRKPLPGKKTHRIRRRLTKSWWNDKWRDMLLASTGWLADGETKLIDLSAGAEGFNLSSFPMSVETPLSYRDDGASIEEQSDDGEIKLSDVVGHEPSDGDSK